MEGTHVPAGYNGLDSAHGSHGAHGDIEAIATDHHGQDKAVAVPQLGVKGLVESSASSIDEKYTDASEAKPAAAQILGVAILEFGVVFHSVCLSVLHLSVQSDGCPRSSSA